MASLEDPTLVAECSLTRDLPFDQFELPEVEQAVAAATDGDRATQVFDRHDVLVHCRVCRTQSLSGSINRRAEIPSFASMSSRARR